MVHVLGFAIHSLLEGLSSQLVPLPVKESSPGVKALLRDGGVAGGDGGARDENTRSNDDSDGASSEDAHMERQRAASDALVETLPTVMQIVIDDVIGDRAAARGSAGYNPKQALKEARACRSYDTFELLCRCVPFLPNPAVHSVSCRHVQDVACVLRPHLC